jgi:putative pyruvate formate lyase activating enzyme
MAVPSYLRLHRQGVLQQRAESAQKLLEHCVLCPRECGVNRAEGATGTCRTARWAKVASASPHFGEERPLVGKNGSGTVFFASCNLLCSFCQNWDISHLNRGTEVTSRQLASIMLQLQDIGCHNINFVTPTHVVPQVLAALPAAVERGLHIPLVYNTGGYDKVETLKLLEGVFDIYMPDFKFWDPVRAKRFCRAEDYPERAREAIREMHRQVGDLQINRCGLAVRGLLLRHLVMPENAAGTKEVMRFISSEISPDTYVNIMDQYSPLFRADEDPGINRRITRGEYRQALESAREAGLTRLDNRPDQR